LQSGQSQIQKPLPPKTNGDMAGFQFSGDHIIVLALGGQQRNPRTADDFLGRAGSTYQTV